MRLHVRSAPIIFLFKIRSATFCLASNLLSRYSCVYLLSACLATCVNFWVSVLRILFAHSLSKFSSQGIAKPAALWSDYEQGSRSATIWHYYLWWNFGAVSKLIQTYRRWPCCLICISCLLWDRRRNSFPCCWARRLSAIGGHLRQRYQKVRFVSSSPLTMSPLSHQIVRTPYRWYRHFR